MSENTSSGDGTFFHPPIIVTDEATPPSLGQVSQKYRRKLVMDFKLDSEIRILISEDGFICPIMEASKEEIKKFFNVIFATFTTKGVQSHYMLNDDFSSFNYSEGNDYVDTASVKGVYSIRNALEYERDDPETFHLWAPMPRKPVHTTLIHDLVSQAYKFYKNPEFTNDILLIGEAWSLSYDRMHTPSFLSAWMVIETLLEVLWRKMVDSLDRSGKEKDFLKSHSSWSVAHYIQGLSFLKKMDDQTRQSLNKLREVRNQIIHERRQASINEAYDCMNAATKLVYNKMNYGDEMFQEIKLQKIL